MFAGYIGFVIIATPSACYAKYAHGYGYRSACIGFKGIGVIADIAIDCASCGNGYSFKSVGFNGLGIIANREVLSRC